MIVPKRPSKAWIAKQFVAALGKAVEDHSKLTEVPLEVDLCPPLPTRLRVYLYNATHPPGGRTTGEHKIQLIMPGQRYDERGSFDTSGGRIVIVAGYVADSDVFIFWDAGLYSEFPHSRNLQAKPETVYAAFAGKIAEQERTLRVPKATEIVIAVRRDLLAEGLQRRVERTLERLQGG